MNYYSTNGKVSGVSLRQAVIKGLADDKGLFMPDVIKRLPQAFFDTIDTLSFQEMAYTVADTFFGEDVEADALKRIVYETLNFDVPLVKVSPYLQFELFGTNQHLKMLVHGLCPVVGDFVNRARRCECVCRHFGDTEVRLPTVFLVSRAFMFMCFTRKVWLAPFKSANLRLWDKISRHWKLMERSMIVRHW